MIELGSDDSAESASETEAIRRCVVYLSIAALTLTGLGYDPYLRGEEQKAAAEAEAEAEFEGFYAGIEEEVDEEDEDIELNFQPNLYLARIVAPALICYVVTKAQNFQLVQRICGLGHLLVCLCYILLATALETHDILLIFGFLSELFLAAKLVLFYYQIIIYCPTADRSSSILYGVIAQSSGVAILPWVANQLEETWDNTQYFLNLTVAVIHLALLFPCAYWKYSLKESFESYNHFKFPQLVTTAAFGVVILSSLSSVTLQWFLNNNETLLRPFLPFLPFLAGDDFWDTFWNVTYTAIAFTFLGFFCLFLTSNQLMIASSVLTFLTGVAYLYLEEEIPARMALPMSAFTFGSALVQLVDVCPREHLLSPLLGIVFTVVNLATYGYFGLLTLFWDSPDIVLVVVWAANGFFALILLVLGKEIGQRWEQEEEPRCPVRDESGSFRTVITTIT